MLLTCFYAKCGNPWVIIGNAQPTVVTLYAGKNLH